MMIHQYNLTGCTVKGRTVDYAYGKYEAPTYTSYTTGTPIKYNGVDYYVLNDSAKNESTVTLVKATPLTTNEANVIQWHESMNCRIYFVLNGFLLKQV